MWGHLYFCVRSFLFLCEVVFIFVWGRLYFCVRSSLFLCEVIFIFVWGRLYFCVRLSLFLCEVFLIFWVQSSFFEWYLYRSSQIRNWITSSDIYSNTQCLCWLNLRACSAYENNQIAQLTKYFSLNFHRNQFRLALCLFSTIVKQGNPQFSFAPIIIYITACWQAIALYYI